MKIKNDPRKLAALWYLTFILFSLSVVAYKKPGVSIFLFSAGIIHLLIGLLTKYKIYFEDDTLILSSITGLFKKRIPLNSIKKAKIIDKTIPHFGYGLLSLLLWDKKFSRFKHIALYNQEMKLITKIDCHLVDNQDFQKLWKKFK